MEYLYDNYSAVLYGVILNGVKNEAVAEDVLQEVFIKIWKNMQGYDPDRGRLYTWMINIARNSVIDYLRSRQNQKDSRNQPIDDSQKDLHNYNPSEQKTDNIGLRQLVEKLPPNHKEVIDMVYFKGYTQDETSRELKIPLGTVKTRVRSAIITLRSLFSE